ncbi:PASTA domain-containing protein, partial [Clostridium botulinum]
MPDLREEDTDTENKRGKERKGKREKGKEEESDDVPKGQIISQNPSKNTE